MKKKKKIAIIVLIIVIIAGLLAFKTFFAAKNNIKAVNSVDVMKKNLVQSISVTGNIKANEWEEIMLPSTQKVQNVLVEEGQEVKKGQLLVKLDTSDLESQIQIGKISLALGEKVLEKLKCEDNNTIKNPWKIR